MIKILNNLFFRLSTNFKAEKQDQTKKHLILSLFLIRKIKMADIL